MAEVDESVSGGNARLMHEASQALGLPGRTIRRNAKRCTGSARCFQGCPEGARQSMEVSYVPRAVESGARLHSLARATRMLVKRGRAYAVEGELLDHAHRARGRFRVIGRRGVIVSAGAIYTPLLLLASGIRRLVGDGFQAHPAAAVVARFPFPVGMGFGATQSYEVPLHEYGLKLESVSLPPELLASRIPGAGQDWQRRLHHLEYFAQWGSVVRMRAQGKVRRSLLGGPRVTLRAAAPRHDADEARRVADRADDVRSRRRRGVSGRRPHPRGAHARRSSRA